MTKLEEAKTKWKEVSKQFRKGMPTRTVLTGDGKGNAASNLVDPLRPNHIKVRELGTNRVFSVKSRGGKSGPYVDMPVILGYDDYLDPGEEQVLGINYNMLPQGYIGGSAIYGIGPHAAQHMFRGGDEVFIDSRLFLNGLVAPTTTPSMRVQVKPIIYYYKDFKRLGSALSVDFTDYLPGEGNRFVLISIDPDANQLSYTPGQVFAATGGLAGIITGGTTVGGFSYIPSPPGGHVPLAAIFLTDSTTVVNWTSINDNIFDTRLFSQPALGEIHDRLDQVEGYIGSDHNLPVTGAQQNSAQEFKANAWALQGRTIAETAPSDGNILIWSSEFGKWRPGSAVAGSGEINTLVNLGTGIPIFREKSGVNLNIRSIIAGTNMTVSSATSAITVATLAELNTGANLGTGIPIFREKSGASLNFRSLVAGTNITIASAASTITITGAASGESNTAANLGTGIPIFREKSGASINLRTLVAGTNVTISSATSTITISSTGGGATSTSGNVATIFSQTVNKTIENTTSEISLFSAGRGIKTISANTMQVGDTVRISAGGHVSTSGSPQIEVILRVNGSEIGSTGASNLGNNLASANWNVATIMTCRSAGLNGTVAVSGFMEHNNGTIFGIAKNSTTTIDTTSDNLLQLTAIWGLASSANSITCQEAIIEYMASTSLAPVGPSELTATETV